jgi:hypothetical protein
MSKKRTIQAVITQFSGDGVGYIDPAPGENLSNKESFEASAFADQTLIHSIPTKDYIGLNGLSVTVAADMADAEISKICAITLNSPITAAEVIQRAHEMRQQEYLSRFAPRDIFRLAADVCRAAMDRGLRPAGGLVRTYFKYTPRE